MAELDPNANDFESSQKEEGSKDNRLVTYDGLTLSLTNTYDCKPGAIFKNCKIQWFNTCGPRGQYSSTTLCDDAIFIDCDFSGVQSWDPTKRYDSWGNEICYNDSFGHSTNPLTFGTNCIFQGCTFDAGIPYQGLDTGTNLFDKCSGHANSSAPNETKGGDITWTSTECKGSEIDLTGGATAYRYKEPTPTIDIPRVTV